MRQGLRRSRTSTETIDEVARKVGYQTDAKFSARVRRSTGLTPAQVRDLDDDDFEDLLAEQLALRAPPLIG
jgi:AraC-like DNA-binding protein